MPSTINASSSSGIVTTADTSGVLQLQTGGTTAVTVDASQNVGIGTSSPSYRIDAVSTDGIFKFTKSGGASGYLLIGGSSANLSYDTSANYAWAVASTELQAWTAGTKRMVIDASGNVGVGTTTPSSYTSGDQLVIANASGNGQMTLAGADAGNPTIQFRRVSTPSTTRGFIQYDNTSEWMRFATNGSERMRIDSSGNLLVGATSRFSGFAADNKLYVESSTGDYMCHFRSTQSSPFGPAISFSTSPNGTSNAFIEARDSTTARFSVRSNGGIYNFSANNSNLSDERTKTDIQNAGGYLAKICAIPVRTFKYKDQTDDLLNLGVIAQEVEAVAPELVDISGFGETPEDGVPLKAIFQTDLQYALMKCIQEQQALITQLQADVAALKGA